MSDRPIPRRGQFMVGGTHPAEDPRRARIKKGMFLTSTPVIGDVKPVRQFSQVEDTARAAGSLEAIRQKRMDHISEIAQRLHKFREQLDMVKAKAKRR